MNKFIMVVLIAILVGCQGTSNDATQVSRLTLEEARKKALDFQDGEIIETDVDEDGYEIDIVKDNVKYEIEVSKSGSVSLRNQENFASGNVDVDLNTAKSLALSVQSGEIVETSQDEDGFDIDIVSGDIKYEVFVSYQKDVRIVGQEAYRAKEKRISQEEANALALQRVGQGKVSQSKYDGEDNVYEIEIQDGNMIYDIDVDASTGKIISFDRED